MRVTCLGTAGAKPEAGRDTASFMLGERCLIDTGLCAVLKMVECGFDPQELDYVFLTHCHHDHYLGLAPLLFYRRMQYRINGRESGLTVVGPAEDVARVVRLAEDFLQVDRFPPLGSDLEVIPLEPGEGYGTDRFSVTTCPARHGVPGLVYRFEEEATGAAAVFTGDTAPHPPIEELAEGASLLVHDAFGGAQPVPEDEDVDHSGAPDAARAAAKAGVGLLALVHMPSDREEGALPAAREIFPNTVLPAEGQVIEVEGGSVIRRRAGTP